ncbi:MAG: VWA domain-containing protein [candidate division KSB1 bacterium]|nr:VWA domain-containing protein [candidate division KSB1 bacterium]MDZ7319988.1 VWA domain-containing protein [candidate division KSB1 bacterium]MDZ7340989.1 VWA domain-containing protein [candidate division KSB1 bacterium]
MPSLGTVAELFLYQPKVVMEDLHIAVEGSLLLFLMVWVVLIVLSIHTYRWTMPPVPRWLRRILMLLRAAVLFMLLAMLFEPLLRLTWRRTEHPIVAVLVDNSASMSLSDANERRSEKVKAILHSPLFQKSAHDRQFDFYQFSHALLPLSLDRIDSLRFNNDGTDLAGALSQVKEKNVGRYLTAVVLLSDGVYNLGDNPAHYVEDFDVPIFSLGIGSTIEQKDVIISKIATNQVTYVDNQVPVDVTVQANGCAGQTIQVNLREGDALIDSKRVEIGSNLFETKVQLFFTPHAAGFQKYRLEVPALEKELTDRNNQKVFYTRVLESKMRIMLLAGSPDPDFKFIRRNLEADPNMELHPWIVKKNGEFYQGNFPHDPQQVLKYDCIILQNFPGKNGPADVMTVLKNALQLKPIPLLFIAGNGVDYVALQSIGSFLPLTPPFYNGSEAMVLARLTPQGLAHPVTRIVEDPLENQRQWMGLPPIYYSLQRAVPTTGSEILLETTSQALTATESRGTQPALVVVRKLGPHKTMAILGYGIWRWDLMLWGVGKTNDLFHQFLSNSIRWLITKEESRLVRIYPDQEIYRNGQVITFTAEVYYEDYRPLDGAQVKLQITGKQKNYDILLNGIGAGKYEGILQALEGGDYSYAGVAHFNNRVIGADSGQFSVEDFNLEFLQTRLNEPLLQQLAAKTGGRYFSAANYDSLSAHLAFPDRISTEVKEIPLWNQLLLLVLVIVLLAAEWFIRKRSGML